MRRILKVAAQVLGGLVLALLLVACGLQVAMSGRGEVPEKDPESLRVATYNVHYIRMRAQTGDWSVGDWERRRGPLDAAFKTVNADLIGFQEMESFGGGSASAENLALDYLLSQNPDYAAAAAGDPSDFPSTQPILYRPDRLELLDQGWFFFSETPDVIYSRTWDGSWPAFASWARFRPVGGGPAFYAYNLHFTYRSGANRLKSAALVAERLAPRLEAGVPVVLLGDLNAMAGARTVEILEEAGLRFTDVSGATYHFDRGLNLFGAIDHIAVTEGISVAGGPVVLRRKFGGEWPTDHYPVFADLRLPRGE